jgi:predicted NBD/HSP70 family sugar kinase
MTIGYRMRHDESTDREVGRAVIATQLSQQPADLTDVRATNLAVVLGYVRGHAPCSRADIAAATGLNKATVSSLVGELIGRRLLRETGQTERRIGRPATMIVLDGSPYAAIGVQVGPDELHLLAVDLSGQQLLSWHRAIRAGAPSSVLAAIAAQVKRAQARVHDEGRTVLGVTVGLPGLVDESGALRVAPNLGWRDVPVHDTLRRALGEPAYPLVVENDANLAVLAERRYGPYAGVQNLVYLTGGQGITAGIIAAGQLIRGGRGFAGEIGHVPVDPAGPQCACGRRGCLEACASVGALLRRLGRSSGDDVGDGPMGGASVGDGTMGGTDMAPEVDDVIRRARTQEPVVLAALRDVGRHLGHAASLLANILNPEVVILGGYYVQLAPWLLPAAQEQLAGGTVAPDTGGLRLVASALGTDAAAAGAAAHVLDSVDTGQLPVAAST